MPPPTPEQIATAKKVVAVITGMVPMGETPPWMKNVDTILGELGRRMNKVSVSTEQFGSFINQFKASQDFLSEDVKNLKSKWEDQPASTFLGSLKADILAAYPGARGGRRTRRRRSRKYRSRK